ncbi:MAG: NAD-dependent epimerase/dehydratase family protein [Betaproteobacteria bacterium]
MRILFLGGTKFLGRHAVDVALARGHDVTVFTRGRSPKSWPNHRGEGITAWVGERDPLLAPGLGALRDGTWDAVIDTCGYVPRVVRASAQLLQRRVGQYLFVSSISVYAGSGADRDESAATGPLDDPATEDVAKHYGPLKAACEDQVRAVYADAATIVRPGIIVGPHDATDRFGYWVARFRHPALLGDRPATAMVPAPRDAPMQIIDARDLAAWMIDLVEAKIGGTFNANSPARHWTMGNIVDALREHPATPQATWVDEELLLEQKVEPWTGLPLWIPSTFTDDAGFMEFDCRRAVAAGLRTRSLSDTIDATAAWLAARDNDGAWKAVLTAAQEREILAFVAGRSMGEPLFGADPQRR